MRFMWLNDALCFRPDDESERHTLANFYEALKNIKVEPIGPSTGASEATYHGEEI